MRAVPLVASVLSLLALLPPPARPADPPARRLAPVAGPDPRRPARRPAWPDTLGDDALPKQVWRVDRLGPSYSGPVVAGDRVFTTLTVDQKTEVVTAHDRKTGKELWRASWAGSVTAPFFASASVSSPGGPKVAFGEVGRPASAPRSGDGLDIQPPNCGL